MQTPGREPPVPTLGAQALVPPCTLLAAPPSGVIKLFLTHALALPCSLTRGVARGQGWLSCKGHLPTHTVGGPRPVATGCRHSVLSCDFWDLGCVVA